MGSEPWSMQVPRRKRHGTGRGRSRIQRKAVGGKKGAMLDLFAVKNQIDEMVADEYRRGRLPREVENGRAGVSRLAG